MYFHSNQVIRSLNTVIFVLQYVFLTARRRLPYLNESKFLQLHLYHINYWQNEVKSAGLVEATYTQFNIAVHRKIFPNPPPPGRNAAQVIKNKTKSEALDFVL